MKETRTNGGTKAVIILVGLQSVARIRRTSVVSSRMSFVVHTRRTSDPTIALRTAHTLADVESCRMRDLWVPFRNHILTGCELLPFPMTSFSASHKDRGSPQTRRCTLAFGRSSNHRPGQIKVSPALLCASGKSNAKEIRRTAVQYTCGTCL